MIATRHPSATAKIPRHGRNRCDDRSNEIGVAPHIVEAVLNHVSGHKAGVAGTYNKALYREEKRAALEAWGQFILAQNAEPAPT
jgi:hypothetical protein